MGALRRVRSAWAGLSRRQRLAWLLALTLSGVGWAVPRLALRDPALAVAAAAAEPGGGAWSQPAGQTRFKGKVAARDPWGHRLRGFKAGMGAAPTYYSLGPNGEDEEGLGDDVTVTPALRARVEPYLRARNLASLAFLILWFMHGPHASSRRSPKLGRELGRAVTLSVGLVIFSPGVFGLFLGRDLTPYWEAIAERSPGLVPPVVSILGSYLVACYTIALAWRLTRPDEKSPDATTTTADQ